MIQRKQMNLKKMMKLPKRRQLRKKQLHRRRLKGMDQMVRRRRRMMMKRRMMNLQPQEVRQGREGLGKSERAVKNIILC